MVDIDTASHERVAANRRQRIAGTADPLNAIRASRVARLAEPIGAGKRARPKRGAPTSGKRPAMAGNAAAASGMGSWGSARQ